MPRHRLLHSQATGRQGRPPPPASPGCVLLLSPQPQAADGPKQTAANEDHQTPGANQMSGNEKVAHEEYHLIRPHHLSKTDGLFIVLWQFWIFTTNTQQVQPSLALLYLLQSGYTVWKHWLDSSKVRGCEPQLHTGVLWGALKMLPGPHHWTGLGGATWTPRFFSFESSQEITVHSGGWEPLAWNPPRT